ncbi:hypothetical protein GGR42_000729 [Saonia flava]|uniref:Tryptophan-rich sensory protein n=1 Tax=Saonia flava TaxID=523696 RepID=A0A846QSS8_9FLAO|nr:tryptophan-rich sensory protein [Saonia flava]NJB70267.1 hypothetical protein [Saonia flava]
MTDSGKNILMKFKKRWLLMQGLEIFLYAIGPSILIYILSSNIILSVLLFITLVATLSILYKPWKLNLDKICHFLDNEIKSMEYSTGLLLKPKEQLSTLGILQQYRVTDELDKEIGKIQPINHLKTAGITFFLCIIISFFAYNFNWSSSISVNTNGGSQHSILVQPVDSLAMESIPPILESQQLTILYPLYTKNSPVTTEEMDITALEGSRLSWGIKFKGEVKSVVMESGGDSYPMKLEKGEYIRTMTLKESGFYNFRFTGVNGGSYISDLYVMEVTKDKSPVLEIQDLNQFTSFSFYDKKELSFKTLITDDYGINEVYIIATVTKGEGESVKFREEKLNFDDRFSKGLKRLSLFKKINLDNLKMEPGDELYFHVEAIDSKQPNPNITKGETYFAVIKDTATNQFAVEGTMGVDLMPDYFRSQRQLIIDTEKLIANQSKLTKKEFNATSNELGFDQKALRLKYGQFMGDEADSGIQVTEEISTVETVNETEDPLEEYTHDHDGDNEHNLVDHEHEEDTMEEADDPLSNFLHNHDDPEESTLFTQSLRSKLKQAMGEMWDAELYLRLYTPKESLPYQYRALKLIQEIKNSARIYVHRIGFDPPPIKEEVRLTGDLDEVVNFQKKEGIGKAEENPFMRQAVFRLEELILNRSLILEEDKALFKGAGMELALMAIKEPGKHLKTLQRLKWLTEDTGATMERLKETQRGLLQAIKVQNPNPKKGKATVGKINELVLKELEVND